MLNNRNRSFQKNFEKCYSAKRKKINITVSTQYAHKKNGKNQFAVEKKITKF